MTVTPSDLASLTKSLSRWELAEYICAGLVTIACFGEYVAEFTEWFTGGLKQRKERLAKRSTLLLVGALSLELICLVKTNQLSGLLIGSLSEKAGKAASDAALAIDRAGQVEQTTKSLADRVVSLDKATDAVAGRMESASRQLGKLEQQIRVQGPRLPLLEDGKATFIEALKPFAGQRVTVMRCGPTTPPEQFMLEQNLLILLRSAAWAVDAPGYSTWTRCPDYVGNLLMFSSTANDEVKGSAKALGSVLNKIGIRTVPMESTPEFSRFVLQDLGADSPWALAAKDPTAVFLLVGVNPMFDIGAFDKRRK